MAQIEGWLFKRLSTESNILAATGTGKVYPLYAPQRITDPCITFRRSSTQREYTTTGNSGLPTATFDITCWDTDYHRLMTWSDYVRKAIDGYKLNANGFDVQSAFITEEEDVPEPQNTGSEALEYGRHFVLEVSFTEEVVDYVTA